MKLNSISGTICYVKNLDKTAEFYETLGFRPGKREGDCLRVYVNWFWIEFRQSQSKVDNSKNCQYICINVDNVDEYYESLVSKGLHPQGEVTDLPTGNKEFCIPDPDGYKLVFFQKSK